MTFRLLEHRAPSNAWQTRFCRGASHSVGPVSARTIADLLDNGRDPTAWAELVDRFGGLVWSVARGFRFDDATCADVCQNVWVKLYEKRDTIRDPEKLGSWLAITTRNEAVSMQRRQVREQPTEDTAMEPALPEDDVADSIVDSMHDSRLRDVVQTAFERISESCQQLLRLMSAEPRLEYATIAEITGRPIGSLGPTRARCLARLKSAIADVEPEMAT